MSTQCMNDKAHPEHLWAIEDGPDQDTFLCRGVRLHLKGTQIMTGRRFWLFRRTDPSGVSGTGVVAHGIQWPDGTVSMRWMIPGLPASFAVWDRIEDVEAVHGHQGQTIVEWID